MASISRREASLILSVFLITTAGILMALLVSLVLNPSNKSSKIWVEVQQSSLYEMASACNCSTDKLKYMFPRRLKSVRKFSVDKREVAVDMAKQGSFEAQDECFLPAYSLQATERQNISSAHSNLFSGIVSINAPRFLDDTDDRIYKCAGALVAPFLAITATECISSTPSNLLNVRSGSRYWSTEGEVHRVTKVRRHGRLAMLELDPPAKKSAIPISLNLNYAKSWATAVSAGWDDRCRKHASIHFEDWTKDECRGCRVAHVDKNATECTGHHFVGDPLLSEDSALIGIRYCDNLFIDVRVEGTAVWPSLLAPSK